MQYLIPSRWQAPLKLSLGLGLPPAHLRERHSGDCLRAAASKRPSRQKPNGDEGAIEKEEQEQRKHE
jgi:hypothetical protein